MDDANLPTRLLRDESNVLQYRKIGLGLTELKEKGLSLRNLIEKKRGSSLKDRNNSDSRRKRLK